MRVVLYDPSDVPRETYFQNKTDKLTDDNDTKKGYE